jgi:hypothetical protein
MTLVILNKSGAELYRKDFTIDTSPEEVFLQTNNHKASFNSPDKPDKIVMYLFDEHKQWSNRYEKNI